MSKRKHVSMAEEGGEAAAAAASDQQLGFGPTASDAVWKLERTLTCAGLDLVKFDQYGNPKDAFFGKKVDYINGPATSQARLRLFGRPESEVRVVLYRDNHAWCPYCHKVWLYLEEKRIPYRVNKITMFCYGQKEAWFTRHVNRRGMIPAITIDGNVIMESDDIILELENHFGPLRDKSINDPKIVEHRVIERRLFGAWCDWLCQDNTPDEERKAHLEFAKECEALSEMLAASPGPFLMGSEPVVSDVVLVPFLERMAASLFYFKGFDMKNEFPLLNKFLDAWQGRDQTFRGTMGDYHTHVHALPPQMGGCYFSPPFSLDNKPSCAQLVDKGPYDLLADVSADHYPYDPQQSAVEAAEKVERHWEIIAAVNAYSKGNGDDFDICMRYAITHMLVSHGLVSRYEMGDRNSSHFNGFPENAELILRYARDRISVPRDMSVWAAKTLRTALEEVAQSISSREPPPPPTEHRLDQDPHLFTGNAAPVDLPPLNRCGSKQRSN